MSHSSGISVSENLRNSFSKGHGEGSVRLIKVQIENDSLVSRELIPGKDGDGWEKAMDLNPSYCDPNEPCYLLFRLDEQNEQGYLWLLLCYVPDTSKVKDKMIYASTRGNLKNQLGSSKFSHEIFGTSPDEFNMDGYKAHLKMQNSAAPLTASEEQQHYEISQCSGEAFNSGGGGGSIMNMHGVNLPVETDVVDALKNLISAKTNYVQLGIKNEKIILNVSKTISVLDLPKEIPDNIPAFHYFKYSHKHEGKALFPVIFVYSCPDGSSNTKSTPIKERMIYSTSKANVLSIFKNISSDDSSVIDARFEINAADEISEEIINSKLHPVKIEKSSGFKRPSRPGGSSGRGGRRLIRGSPSSSPSPTHTP